MSATSDDAKSNHSSIPRWHIGSACSNVSPGRVGGGVGGVPMTASGMIQLCPPRSMGVIIDGGIQLPGGQDPKPFNFNTLPNSSEGKQSTQNEGTSGGSATFMQGKSGAENSTSGGAKKNSSLSNNSKTSAFLKK